MKNTKQTIIAVLAVIVILVAAVFLYRNLSPGGPGGSETVILPGDPKKTDPNFDPSRNAPPGIAGVGGPAEGN